MPALKLVADDMLPVYESETGEKFVNARELHEKLMSKRQFSDWITTRVNNYGFIEGEDFFTWTCKNRPGRPSTEYYLVLDVAKEMAMVEQNEMGRSIRKYFIEVEKKSRRKPQTQLEVLQGVVDQMVLTEHRVSALENTNKELREENQVLKHRMDNIDHVDVIGDKKQRLNAMVRKYAAQNGIRFDQGWRDFRQAYNTAYRTNITLLIENYQFKNSLKKVTTPEYLSSTDRLEDGIRVADKMLNQTSMAK